MTCQIATVLSALLAVGSAQAADGVSRPELRPPVPATATAATAATATPQKRRLRLDAHGRATLKPAIRSGAGVEEGS